MGRRNTSVLQNGQNAGYIPALGKVNSSQLGISVIGTDGSSVRYGDWDVPLPCKVSQKSSAL